MRNVELFMGNRLETKPIKRTPKNAVMAFCLHCTSGNHMELKLCTANDPGYSSAPYNHTGWAKEGCPSWS